MNLPRNAHPLLLALPCYALDQATKWALVRHLQVLGSDEPVIPGFFDLVYLGNTGAAFSMFRNHPLFFVILSIATLLGLLVASARGAFRAPLHWWGVGLLMGGILGNVTDRLVHGYVVDFLLFDLHFPPANPWPAFNVADSCICLAVGLFLLAAFRESREGAPGKA